MDERSYRLFENFQSTPQRPFTSPQIDPSKSPVSEGKADGVTKQDRQRKVNFPVIVVKTHNKPQSSSPAKCNVQFYSSKSYAQPNTSGFYMIKHENKSVINGRCTASATSTACTSRPSSIHANDGGSTILKSMLSKSTSDLSSTEMQIIKQDSIKNTGKIQTDIRQSKSYSQGGNPSPQTTTTGVEFSHGYTELLQRMSESCVEEHARAAGDIRQSRTKVPHRQNRYHNTANVHDYNIKSNDCQKINAGIQNIPYDLVVNTSHYSGQSKNESGKETKGITTCTALDSDHCYFDPFGGRQNVDSVESTCSPSSSHYFEANRPSIMSSQYNWIQGNPGEVATGSSSYNDVNVKDPDTDDTEESFYVEVKPTPMKSLLNNPPSRQTTTEKVHLLTLNKSVNEYQYDAISNEQNLHPDKNKHPIHKIHDSSSDYSNGHFTSRNVPRTVKGETEKQSSVPDAWDFPDAGTIQFGLQQMFNFTSFRPVSPPSSETEGSTSAPRENISKEISKYKLKERVSPAANDTDEKEKCTTEFQAINNKDDEKLARNEEIICKSSDKDDIDLSSEAEKKTITTEQDEKQECSSEGKQDCGSLENLITKDNISNEKEEVENQTKQDKEDRCLNHRESPSTDDSVLRSDSPVRRSVSPERRSVSPLCNSTSPRTSPIRNSTIQQNISKDIIKKECSKRRKDRVYKNNLKQSSKSKKPLIIKSFQWTKKSKIDDSDDADTNEIHPIKELIKKVKLKSKSKKKKCTEQKTDASRTKRKYTKRKQQSNIEKNPEAAAQHIKECDNDNICKTKCDQNSNKTLTKEEADDLIKDGVSRHPDTGDISKDVNNNKLTYPTNPEDEKLLQEICHLLLSKWDSYLQSSDQDILVTEVENALRHGYNEESLDMISNRDLSVWQILDDMKGNTCIGDLLSATEF